MKITVDTKHDSKTEIEQAILLLTKLVEAEQEYVRKVHKDKSEGSTEAFANMFAQSGQKKVETEPQEECEEETPQVELY